MDECFCVCCKAQPSSGSHLFRAAAYGGKCRRVDTCMHVRDTPADFVRSRYISSLRQITDGGCNHEKRFRYACWIGMEGLPAVLMPVVGYRTNNSLGIGTCVLDAVHIGQTSRVCSCGDIPVRDTEGAILMTTSVGLGILIDIVDHSTARSQKSCLEARRGVERRFHK